MISVKDRAPLYPGRVQLNPVPGVPNRFDMSRQDEPTEAGTPFNRRTMQLLQADVRTLPIAAGNTVAAGDVVDAVGAEVQKTWQGNANAKVVFNNSQTTYATVDKLNETQAIIGFVSGGAAVCRLLNSVTGAGIGNPASAYANVTPTNISCKRLSNTTFVLAWVGNTSLQMCVGTVSGTSGNVISFGTILIVTGDMTDYNCIVPLSATSFISIYNRSGLKAKVCTVSGTTITAGAEYSLSGSTSTAFISATRLPDDGVNRRVCVCYSDTADGNKGKTAIVTINASNVVSWGPPVVFEESAIYGTSCCTDGSDVVVSYATATNIVAKIMRGASEPQTGTVVGQRSGNTLSIQNVGGVFSVLWDDTTSRTGGSARVLIRAPDDSIDKGNIFTFSTGSAGSGAQNITSAVVEDGRLIGAFSDPGNSNYGTATILTVRGNQIAGSFTDTSSQAIALQSGTAGQSIDIIFDGVAELPGIVAGTQITSPGVQGYAPQDGWLWVRPEWDNLTVSGLVTATSSTTTVTLGFRPSLVLFGSAIEMTTNTSREKALGFIGGNGYSLRHGFQNLTGGACDSVTRLTDTGFTMPNTVSGWIYHYTAFKF